MRRNYYQQLTVKSFFKNCNWSKQEYLLTENKNLADSWQTISVQKFFDANNWNGELIVNGNKQNTLVFSLTLTVPDFFRCFNWTTQDSASYTEKNMLNNTEDISFVEEFNFAKSKKTISINDFSELF